MAEVQPIRDKKTIESMKTALLKQSYRDYMIFVIGINTGFRISDLLRLKVSDVKDKTHITLLEAKTGKSNRMVIKDELIEVINNYIQNMEDDEYIFKSQKGNNQHIGRVQAYRILNKAATTIGITEFGPNSLRKTFGYWHYSNHKDVATLQTIFNHSSEIVTLRYIGLTSEKIDESVKSFYL